MLTASSSFVCDVILATTEGRAVWQGEEGETLQEVRKHQVGVVVVLLLLLLLCCYCCYVYVVVVVVRVMCFFSIII